MAPPPLRLAVAAAAAISVLLPATASASPQQARSSAAFVDSIGVNIHSSFGNTPYDDHARVLATLKDLGVRNVRDGLFTPAGAPSVIARQKQFRANLADAGIRSELIMGSPGENAAAYVNSIKDEGPRVLSGIEGPNEWDISGRAAWASEVRTYQQQLYAAAKAQPGLSGVPVLGPSLANNDRADTLGNVGAWTDQANLHLYPGGRAPGTFDDGLATIAQKVSGGEPAVITETGYHNAMYQPGGHAPTSEAATATYMQRLFLDNFRRGITRTFGYELINAHNDPVKMSANYNFGLLRNDWSAKPVYGALKNLIALTDPQAADTAAGSLDYSLSGNSGVQQVLLRRNDGAFALVLWQTAPVWDAYGRREIGVAPKTVKVSVAAPADIATGRPQAGTGLTAVASGTTSASVSVPGGDALVVVIRPTGAPAPPPVEDGVTDKAPTAPVPPAPSTPAQAPTSAPRLTLQQQWDQAMRNLKRRLGLRTAEKQAQAKKAKARAKAKAKAKKRSKKR